MSPSQTTVLIHNQEKSLQEIEAQKVKEGKISSNKMLPFKKNKAKEKQGTSDFWKALAVLASLLVVLCLCFVGFRLVDHCSDKRDHKLELDIELEEREEDDAIRRRKAERKRFHQEQVEAQLSRYEKQAFKRYGMEQYGTA